LNGARISALVSEDGVEELPCVVLLEEIAS
jgi:hypothetical protein